MECWTSMCGINPFKQESLRTMERNLKKKFTKFFFLHSRHLFYNHFKLLSNIILYYSCIQRAMESSTDMWQTREPHSSREWIFKHKNLNSPENGQEMSELAHLPKVKVWGGRRTAECGPNQIYNEQVCLGTLHVRMLLRVSGSSGSASVDPTSVAWKM